jgi:nucleoside-diphosphate-sugar epimerase
MNGNGNGNGATNGHGNGARHGHGATNGHGNGTNGRKPRRRGLVEAVRPLLPRRWAGPVLVVGGGGYIGMHVVEQLLAEGRRVRVLDRLMFGRAPLRDFLANPGFELIEGDATDIFKLIQAMHGASAVVHLAGLVGDPACAVDERFTRHANVLATRVIRKAAQSLGVPRFVFASSCSVYGISPAEVDETSEVNPVSLYARTKVESERELLLDSEEGSCVTILRFATVFGHSRRPRFDLVANLFTAQAVNDRRITLMGPSQWRPFVHVRDVARALVAVLDAEPERVCGQVFNVGDRRLNMTIGQLARLVEESVSRMHRVEVVERPSKDLRNYAVSFEKIRRELGFEAETTIEMGIEEIVSEFAKGTYGRYGDAIYSNLAMTKALLPDFRRRMARLYRRVAEGAPSRDGVENGAGRPAHDESRLEQRSDGARQDRLVAGLGGAVILL